MSNIIADGDDKLNIQTGYFTRKSFTKDDTSVAKYEATITALIRSTRKLEDGRYWYLTTMALPAGILFPAGSPNDYEWLVAPVVAMEVEQKDAYKDSGDAGETRVAIEDAKKFQKFQEALVYLGML